MTKKDKYDGVIEAVHFDTEGQVEWVRAYLRRWVVFSDRVILQRDELIQALKEGKKFVIGKRIQYKGNDFEVSEPVNLIEKDGKTYLIVGDKQMEHDDFTGVPVL